MPIFNPFRRSPPLHSLLKAGKLDTIQTLIKNNSGSIQETNPDGVTFFQKAILKGRWDVIGWLLYGLQKSRSRQRYPITSIKSEIIALFSFKQTSLRNNDGKEIIVSLVEQKLLKPDIKLKEGLTPLHMAYQAKRLDIFGALLEQYSPTPGTNDSGYDDFLGELLYLSLEKRDFPTAKLLLNKNANPNALPGKKSPLELAFEFGFTIEQIDYLLRKGANPNIYFANHQSPLHVAYEQNVELVDLLLEYGADINIQDNDKAGNTLLHLAVQAKLPDQIQALLDNGADPNVKNNQELTPLELVFHDTKVGISWEIVKSLINGGAIPNIKQGINTLLTLALQEKQWEAFKFVLEKMPNDADTLNIGDLIYKLYDEGKYELVSQLLEKGANPNKPDSRTREYLLHRAIVDHNTKLVNLLLKYNADLNIKYTHTSETPLSRAFKKHQWTLAQYLIPYAPPLNDWDTMGFSINADHPLVMACKQGQWEVIRTLLEKDDDPLDLNKWAQLPKLLHTAIAHKEHGIAIQLIKKGVKPNSNSVLHAVIGQSESDTAELVRLLLEKGINPNQQNAEGNTALHVAIENKVSSSVIDALLESSMPQAMVGETVQQDTIPDQAGHDATLQSKKLDPNCLNKQGRSALHLAIEQGAPAKLISMLLEKGADPNQQDTENNTALHIAIENKVSSSVIGALLESSGHITPQNMVGEAVQQDTIPDQADHDATLQSKKLDLNRLNQQGRSALHFAIEQGASAKLINMLLEKGADPNQKDTQGNTALHIALDEETHDDIIQLLLEKGADPNIPYGDGNFALHVGISEGYSIHLIETLLEKGVNPNQIDNDGDTPLKLAFEQGWLTCFERLLAANADINGCDHKGNTLLHNCLLRESINDDIRKKMVATLLAYKADPNITNPDNQTALSLAITCQQSEIISLLLERNAKHPYADDYAFLYHIASNNQLDILRTLIHSRLEQTLTLNPNRTPYRSEYPITLLHVLLLREENLAAAEMILAHSDPRDVASLGATLPIHIEHARWNVATLLLKHHEKLNITKDSIPNGEQLLHEALQRQQWKLAEYLFAIGITLNHQHVIYDTPLLKHALQHEEWGLAGCLLNMGFELDTDNTPNANSLLYYALNTQNWALAMHCLQLGIQLNAHDYYSTILNNAYQAKQKADQVPDATHNTDDVKSDFKIKENLIPLLEAVAQYDDIKVPEWLFASDRDPAPSDVKRGRTLSLSTAPSTRFTGSPYFTHPSSPSSSIDSGFCKMPQPENHPKEAEHSETKPYDPELDLSAFGIKWTGKPSSSNNSGNNNVLTEEPSKNSKLAKFHEDSAVKKALNNQRLSRLFQSYTRGRV